MRDAALSATEPEMSVLADREILPLRDPKEALECARMMASAEPWITLGISPELAHVIVSDSARQLFLVRDDRGVAAFIILDMRGLLAGYIGVLCVREDRRRQGLGTALIEWAEARIFKSSPNVFICVSSFNTEARRLYERLGFAVVGRLHDFVVPGHDELLLRKTRASWSEFRKAQHADI
jgi:ribosomal protein S18 acetylase RimI-like enzyme